MWAISSFYSFHPISDPAKVGAELTAFAETNGLHGLVILAKEGFNAGLAAPDEATLARAKEYFRNLQASPDLDEKDSTHPNPPFQDFQVKIRSEIVSLGRPDLFPRKSLRKLSAEQWDQAIREGGYLLDTRNTYESRIGSFRGAYKPELEKFSEFPEEVRRNPPPKDRPLLIFCTGGIRCEKALIALEEQGYDNVYQLNGGILRYLEETGGGEWEGECFVFDKRVAVTRELKTTETYALCPLCGSAAEIEISCDHCGQPARLCPDCHDLHVCSKNCRHHRHELHRPGVKPRS